MKKIVSLIMAVLMLCALCVPAFAAGEVSGEFLDEVLALANETPRSEFFDEGAMLISTEIVNEGLDPSEDFTAYISYFEAAGEHLMLHDQSFCAFMMYYYAYLISYSFVPYSENTDILLNKLLDCAEPAVSQMMEEDDPEMAAEVYDTLGSLYSRFMDDQETAGEYYANAAEFMVEAAEKALADGNLALAIDMYETASAVYACKLHDDESSEKWHAEAEKISIAIFEAGGTTGGTASTLSEGSLAIVCSVAAFAVGMAVMFFIMKKKKTSNS